jgi:mono/diheme cytochrome c family protein/cytochrome c553
MLKSSMKSFCLVALAVLFAGTLSNRFEIPVFGADDRPTKESVQFFKDKVRPILTQNCYPCHTDAAMGHLRLDSREGLLIGGGRGPAIVPGDPEKSLLIEAVRQTGALKMPLNGRLDKEQIADLIEWIKMGAPWEASEHAEPTVAPVSPTAAGSSVGEDFFETKVRPIFANVCSNCHGDAATSGLRVDSRESLLKGGSRGPALVPNDPDKSLMIQAVRQTGDLKMPKGGKLTPEEVQSLTEWVKMGAPWPQSKKILAATSAAPYKISPEQRAFWSFQALKTPATPSVKNAAWAKTAIDRFVLAKLESQGIPPAPPADRRTLIRRATFDLTGLPPTPEEIEAFEKDKSPQAFEKVVDRLLASPRYGERWGRHWLDVARYAEDDVRGLDPKGRGYMPFNGAYAYRDWVIKAFNQDIPYDQFVRMQLAGDLLDGQKDSPKPEDVLPATAFLGGGPWLWDQAEPVQGRADERNERIDAVSRGLLGLTVACARCHNHKYDPISQHDYYALAGVFASSTYKEYPLVSETQVAAWRQKEQQLLDLSEQLDDFTKAETQQLSSILAAQTSQYMVAAWRVIGKPKATVAESAEQSHLDPEMLDRWVKFLAQPPKFYPYLKDWQAMIATGGKEEDEAKALADAFQKLVLQVEIAQKGIKEQNEVIKAKADVKKRSRRDALPNEFETDDQFCPGCNLELKTLPTEQASLWVDLFLRSMNSDEDKPEPGLFVFRKWALKRRLSAEWREYIDGLEHQIDALKKSLDPQYPFVHGISDKPKPVNIAVNVRGNPHTLGDEVPRRFLAVLSSPDAQPFTKGSGRLELANDIVSSPLAVRVFVNRVWKWHFGSGIVGTPDNFGVAGERPSNPELLEYVASSFKQRGMSVKKLQREIMLSAVYQTSAQESAEAHEKDGSNRLYSHFNRQRLDAESIRDSVLFVAGDLDLKEVGGPSKDFGLDNARRTVYCKVSRFRLNNYLQVFDFPNPSFTAEQRFSTNVPLQRLYFMNNDFVYAQAGKLAERVHSRESDAARIAEAYRLLYGRAPTAKEIEVGLQFLKTTPEKPGNTVNGEPVTAWKEYARVLLSANEFEFVD